MESIAEHGELVRVLLLTALPAVSGLLLGIGVAMRR
jgi:hypothetical protein